MKRLATALLAAAAVFFPVLSGFGHQDIEIAASLDEREVIVTGHEERDRTLHIEAASGVVHQRCPECVLEKRRSASDRLTQPILAMRPSGPRTLQEESVRPSLESLETGPARAPPLV